MQSEMIPTTSNNNSPTRRGWARAYLKFLVSPQESFVLKVAPLALVLGTPEVIVSNFLPVVGELTDVGELILWGMVIFRTARAVRRYY
jgi:hypothetical protein